MAGKSPAAAAEHADQAHAQSPSHILPDREKDCLYALGELLIRDDLSAAQLLPELVAALGRGGLRVRVVLGQLEAVSPGFAPDPATVPLPITIHGQAAGTVESDPAAQGPSRLLQAALRDLERWLESSHARQALEAQRRQWEATFDAIPDLIAILDQDYRLVRVNRAMADHLGSEAEECVGQHCFNLVHGADAPWPSCPLTSMLNDGKSHLAEITLGQGERERAFLVSASPIHDEAGNTVGCVHLARDITGVKLAEQAYQEQVGFLERLLDTIPNPVYFKDTNGVYTGCNAAFAELVGRRRDEILGRQLEDLIGQDLAEIYQRRDRELLASPGTQIYEGPMRLPDGSLHQAIFNKATFTDGEGELAGIVGVMVDITTNKLVEQALRESEERYRTLVETITEGMIQVDEQARIRFFNDRLSQMLGYDSRELYGRPVTDFLDDENRKILTEQFARRREGSEDSYELTFTAKDGHQVHTIVYPKPHFATGRFLGSFALITDITERKNLERQLMQSQKLEAIGSLAAGIAHEINTPTQYVSDNTHFMRDAFHDLFRVLTGYIRLAGLLRATGRSEPAVAAALAEVEEVDREVDGDYLMEEVPKAIEQTLEGLARISKIVRSMKEFAHPGPEEKTPTDLNKALENTVTVAKNEWKYVAEVELDLDRGLPPVSCVPSEINQVFLNIIVNAAQALAEVVREGEGAKGRIVIATRRHGDHAEITISDNGPGIPLAVQSRVFDPFFTTKPPGRGTGQGLAIAQRVVSDKHRGNLLFSSHPGQGTTFVVRLPLDG
ncbi:MAG: PAS domain S-box protein [Pseudomonadota bacterium]